MNTPLPLTTRPLFCYKAHAFGSYYEQKRREHLTQGDEAADSKGYKLQQVTCLHV